MEITLRKCAPDDVRTLRDLAVRTYDETFAAVNTPENMEAFYRDAYALEKLSAELLDESSRTYFLYCDEDLAGYMKVNVGSAQTDIFDENALELQRIYLLRKFYGKGLADILMQKAFAIAQELGKSYIWLGVWERNFRAQRFYNKYGFYKISEHPFVMGTDSQTDWVLKKDLT
mgnify:CR=1 FL=1